MKRAFSTLLGGLALACAALAAEPNAPLTPAPPAGAPVPAALTVETLTAAVPPEAVIKKGAKWQPLGTALATQALRAKGIGQPIDFRIKVAVIEPHTANGHTLFIRSTPAPVRINGTAIPCVVWAYFDADGIAGLSSVHAGESITITGELEKSDIELGGESATLVCNLLKARLKQPAARR